MEGHEESDLKGYQKFEMLAAALKKEGIDLSDGDYTLLAPPDTAFEKHAAEVGSPRGQASRRASRLEAGAVFRCG